MAFHIPDIRAIRLFVPFVNAQHRRSHPFCRFYDFGAASLALTVTNSRVPGE
jgi:hypothetical protein